MPPKAQMMRVNPPRHHPSIQCFNRKDNSGLRKKTLSRDLYICQHCLEPYPEYNLQCDHVIPLHENGEDNLSNTQTLCVSCHDTKTAMERNK